MRVYRELCADLTFIIDAQVQTGCSTWYCPLKRKKTLQVPENCLGCGKFLALADGQLPDCCDPKKRTTACADSRKLKSQVARHHFEPPSILVRNIGNSKKNKN